MDDKSLMTRRAFLSAAALFLAAHSVALALSRQSEGISALFVLAASLSAAWACYLRSTRTTGPVRRKWDFLASALCLWSIGEAISALRWFIPSLTHINALGPEFYFLVYGIPVLLAVSSSNEERDSVLFVLIDSFQAVFAVGLVYLEITLARSGTGPLMQPANLANLYAAGSWLLAGAASLRLFARPRGEERQLYRILVVYLLTFAALATPFRGTCLLFALPIGGYRDLLADITFFVLAAGCLLAPLGSDPEKAPFETNSFALVLNNGSPILFTLAVLAMGALIARRHFGLGISAIALSLIIYCFRAALLQSAYMSAQHALTRSQFALREANSRLKELSLHDALTGLPNRRQFDQTLEMEWNRAMRTGRPLSLLMVDVDCFKDLNDRYGHPAGDLCLSKVASALRGALRRAGESVNRYGGEEFAAILPEVDIEGALSVAESMREAVLSLRIPHEASTVKPFVTASVGVATIVPLPKSWPAELVAAADDALYRAKRNGRDRVEAAASATMGSR
jgi:diguanylate cyclase (GGDEF)-like protein